MCDDENINVQNRICSRMWRLSKKAENRDLSSKPKANAAFCSRHPKRQPQTKRKEENRSYEEGEGGCSRELLDGCSSKTWQKISNGISIGKNKQTKATSITRRIHQEGIRNKELEYFLLLAEISVLQIVTVYKYQHPTVEILPKFALLDHITITIISQNRDHLHHPKRPHWSPFTVAIYGAFGGGVLFKWSDWPSTFKC